ncbi:MAG: hypothetical protein L6Q29_04660 [Candidatus Pacebacteria bacterium]|nr:hypothetical protein [Candidatus Paceibacterota bacterium]
MMSRSRFANLKSIKQGFLSTLMLLSLTLVSSGFSQPQGPYKIEKIIILRKNIFDNQDQNANFIYSVANRLHHLTDEQVIRNELLFDEGEVYDSLLIKESERNLRALGFIGDISITADTLENQKLLVVVETQDKWTIGVNTGFSQAGQITSFNMGFKDNNFRGKGQKFEGSYNYRSDRIEPHGLQFIFQERHLFGSRWRAKIQYKDSEELTINTFLLDRIFYSDGAEWAASIYTDFGNNLVKEYQNGEIISEYRLSQQNQDLWFSRSFGRKVKFRLTGAYFRNRTQSPQLPPRPFENIDLANFSLNVMNRHYYEGNFLNNFGRIEDISLGYVANVSIGKNVQFFNSNRTDMFVKLDWGHAVGFKKRFYFYYGFAFASYFENRQPKDLTGKVTLLQHLKLPLNQTLVSRFSGLYGSNWSEGRQIVLGSPNGLRGYSAYQFSGQRQLLLNIEDRIFSPLKFWLFRLGGAIFFDSGMVWDENESFKKQKLHSSAGFGLRIENAKQQGGGLTRIDFAFNLDENRFTEVSISSSHLFDAIFKLDFLPPSYLLK